MNDLKFLQDTADANNLSWFYNDKNDLEIKDYNICFHLADLLSGEPDAMDRWKYYHDLNKRCIFVYAPYLLFFYIFYNFFHTCRFFLHNFCLFFYF